MGVWVGSLGTIRERERTKSRMRKKGSCDRMERGRTGDNDRSVGKEKKKEGVT
jgi:hypothetical protein